MAIVIARHRHKKKTTSLTVVPTAS